MIDNEILNYGHKQSKPLVRTEQQNQVFDALKRVETKDLSFKSMVRWSTLCPK